MKRLASLLALLALALHCLGAPTITGTLTYATGNPVANTNITFAPLSTPLANGTLTVGSYPIVAQTANDGTFSVPLNQGDYRVRWQGDSKGFLISVPASGGPYNILSLVVSSLIYTNNYLPGYLPTAGGEITGSLIVDQTLTANTVIANGLQATTVILDGNLNLPLLTQGNALITTMGGRVTTASGTADNTTYLRGDGTYATIPTPSLTAIADGTVGSPAIAWASDNDGTGTGLYRPSANRVAVAANGGLSFQALSAGIEIPTGNQLSWSGNAILTSPGTDVIEQRRGTIPQVFRVYNTYTDPANYEYGGIQWAGNNLAIGTYRAGVGVTRTLTIVVGAISTWQFNAAGNLVCVSDNTYDIGASGSARPRNGYFGTSLTTPSFSTAIVSKTSTYTAASNDHTILCDDTTGSFTVNFPSAVGCQGRMYAIKKINSSVNTVTLDPSGAETIDNNATIGITAQGAGKMIQSDGANWRIIGSF